MGKRKAAEISEEKPDLGREFENSYWEQDVEELDGAARKCGGGRGRGRGGVVLQNRSGHLSLGAPSAGQAKAANTVAGARSSCPSQTLP